MENIKKLVELNILKADEGKMIVHKDELENLEEDQVLTGSKEVYLSESDNASNYVEIPEN